MDRNELKNKARKFIGPMFGGDTRMIDSWTEAMVDFALSETTQLREKLGIAREAVKRFGAWDMLDAAHDGPYFKALCADTLTTIDGGDDSQCPSLLTIPGFSVPVRCTLKAGHAGNKHGGGGCEWRNMD